MDVEGLRRDIDIRLQRRVLLDEKLQERVVQMLKQRRMGPHQERVVWGGSIEGKRMEEEVENYKNSDRTNKS